MVQTPVTIVFGPPGAGKSRFVKEHALEGDLIVDLDTLFMALSGQDQYTKPAALLPFVCEARDAVIERLFRPSDIRHAWIITTEPDRMRRGELATRLKADVVALIVDPGECLRRISRDPRRKDRALLWQEVIHTWWQQYTPDLEE